MIGAGVEVQEVEHKMTKVKRACKIFDKEEGEKLVDSGFLKRIYNSIGIMQDMVRYLHAIFMCLGPSQYSKDFRRYRGEI